MSVHKLQKTAVASLIAFSLVLFLCAGLTAQEVTVSSTDGSPASGGSSAAAQDDPDIAGGYKIKSSIEFGVRFRELDGNEDKYRSDLNYKAGPRLFDSSFYATSEETDGKPFDSFLVKSSGWGGDPNGYARINIGKIGWYEFNSMIRRFKYFNSLANFALGEHTQNTVHNMGDFNLTLLPQNRNFKIRTGFSFDRNSGPGTTTFDYDRDEFPIHFDYDTKSYDFRVGGDLSFGGFNFSLTEGYRKFEDKTTWFIEGFEQGENPGGASLDSFNRMMPIDGKTWYHKLTGHKYWEGVAEVSGRFIYSETETEFELDEILTGTNRQGNPIISDEYFANGDSSHPNGNGDIGVTFFLGDRVQISNTFSVTSYRISGGNILNNPTIITMPPASVSEDLVWRFTDYERYMNTLEGNVDVNKFLNFFLGYRYTDRKVELRGLDEDLQSTSSSTFLEEGENTTNTFLAGFQAKPFGRKWRINFDMEAGDSDNPFTRLSNNEYWQFAVKNHFAPIDELSVSVSFETKDNSNPGLSVSDPSDILVADVKSTHFGVAMSYMPNSTVSVNGGYNFTYLNAETDIIIPTRNFGNGIGMSIYDLRSHYGYFDVWFRPHPRVSIFGAYRISKDTGSGDDFIGPSRTIIGSYPLSFQSPEVRGAVRLTDNIDWNFGYQYYRYDEKFDVPFHGGFVSQDYSAHLPYTSVTIYFGRRD
ncbi:MAG: hypothetical protein DWQ47_08595 [Acidobacteria bacterium]|nr:MAG: hypothetical protein DWQ32_16695 [Acidobacteriota bacterium]REJ99033.1 MAG: hypothetical protein DWQ38_13285 [Acidobacteriota bacterium]REK16246.1 MAG: hypothetical protein DWQ43_04405 [Acidobacteriota bacterium]REK43927.1 MAG: hypothetical protein DWQ47_08595 [Acidobacteriota bacterium]